MSNPVPVLLREPEQGLALAFLGQPALCLAGGSETDERYALLWVRVPPGDGPPPHVHSCEEEGFYLLRGEITFTAGNTKATVGPGSFVNLSIGTAHTLVNSGAETAEYLLIVAPAGFERFVGEAGHEIASIHTPISPPGPPDFERLMAAAQRFGINLHPPASLFETPPVMRLSRHGDAAPLAVGGEVYSILCAGADTGGRYAVVEIEVPAGAGPPAHKHTRATEAFYVLEGEVEFQVEGGGRFHATPGAFVQVPMGSAQRFQASAGGPARMLALLAPAGPEQFFAEAAGADMPALVAAAARHGIELLAEVPA